MTLHPTPVSPVPDATARSAHAAGPNDNLSVQMRAVLVLGSFSTDAPCAALFASRGRPVVPPGRLALVPGPGAWPW